ncbi:MAG TPA: O-antigen ligase family protein [Thermoanaerobaculia bacterium]|nr:O-antigen ligase family protein [Thermoanaerobaculia bacterium]
MTPAAPASSRSLLHYAIGFDLVIIAVGIGLLIPLHPWALVALFVAAAGLAAWRGGWKVGLGTTAFSIAALAIVFDGIVPLALRMLFALAGITASVLAGARRDAKGPAGAVAGRALQTAAQEQAQTRRAAAISNRRRDRAMPLLMYVGLPLIVLVVYTNLSDILIRNFSIPSVLQPLILLLAIPVLRYREAFRPEWAILQPLTIGLIGYCLFVFASSTWARDVAVADSAMVDVLKSLGILIVPACLAVSWRALRGAMIAMVAGAVVLAILTLAQVALDDPDLQFGGLAALEFGHLFGEVQLLRPSGPVGDPNYFARILILALPAAAFLGIGRRSRAERAGYVAAAALIALAIVFTYSRGGMLGLAAVVALIVVAGRVRLTWVNALIIVALLAALLPTAAGQRMMTLGAFVTTGPESVDVDSSLDKRRLLLEAGWRMFTDHPFLGVGAGNFGSHYPGYANLVGWTGLDYTPAGVRQYPHNLYLEMAVETGLLGLLAFLAAMTVALVTLYRSRHDLLQRGESGHAALVTAIAIALAGYLVCSLFLHSGFQRYLWLLLGLAVAAVRLTNESPGANEGTS